jgi:hypothetical protein
MLRYVPKRNVPKKNAQGILQGAWMPHMGSMACSVAWMSCIQSGKIRMHRIAGKFRLPQGMLLMISRYEIQDLKLR